MTIRILKMRLRKVTLIYNLILSVLFTVSLLQTSMTQSEESELLWLFALGSNSAITAIDIAPTLADLAHIPVPATTDGTSIIK